MVAHASASVQQPGAFSELIMSDAISGKTYGISGAAVPCRDCNFSDELHLQHHLEE
jgi:hypothetical protein